MLFAVRMGSYNGDMNTVTLLELQLRPAALLERVRAGESLTIVCDGRAVAELRPAAVPSALEPRPRGRCAGQFRVPDDFDAPLPEEVLRGFEGR
jgi:antitoxin (DNA-binding transcriptional repressor) of toxin-antitoxin stability system